MKRALITGGSRGIGFGIADALARDGFDVGVIFEGAPGDADAVVSAVESHGRRAMAQVVDVRDAGAVNDFVEGLASRWGGLEVVVNNAGIVRDQVSWKMPDDAWRDVLDVNLTGAFNVCRAAIPVLRRSGWGAVVNITSINGMRGKFGQANYAASKAGLIGLTKTLAKELAKFNVTVNAVAPGFIETDIVKTMSEEARQQAIDEILMGRPGRVEDVAEAVAFLCSDRARFITGDVIRVDGGQYV